MNASFGFTAPRLPEIRDDVVAKWKRQFGDNADTAPDQLDGLTIDVWSVFTSIIYEAVSGLVAQHFYPTADGENLDAILSIFGIKSQRQDARGSNVEVIVYGDDTTLILADSTVATTDVGDVFVTDDDVTITAAGIWAVFLFGDTASTTIDTTIGGELSSTGLGFGGGAEFVRDAVSASLALNSKVNAVFPVGVQPDGLAILAVQMTAAHATSITSSSGSTVEDHIGATVFTTSEETGKISGAQGTVTTVTAPIAGWIGVVNIVDATLGAPRASDAQYRSTHEATIGGRGFATPRGLAGSLLEVEGVELVRIFENLSGTPDALGRPSHSFEALVEGGDSQEIAEAIWLDHTTGTQSTGLQSFIVQDTRGQIPVDRIISHTRPIKKYIHARITVARGERFPNLAIFDLEVAIAQAVATWGVTLGVGSDVYTDEVLGQVTSTVTGTESVLVELGSTAAALDPTPPLSSSNIVIADREWSQWADARIEVVIL